MSFQGLPEKTNKEFRGVGHTKPALPKALKFQLIARERSAKPSWFDIATPLPKHKYDEIHDYYRPLCSPAQCAAGTDRD
jgi:hypothetical protein